MDIYYNISITISNKFQNGIFVSNTGSDIVLIGGINVLRYTQNINWFLNELAI